jgi:hypothetical protein
MHAARLATLLAGLATCATAHADRIYAYGFEVPAIEPLFPLVEGRYDLGTGPAAAQVEWILSELASGETTTPAEIAAHFDPAWTIPVAETQAFFQSLRTTFANAVVTDVVAVTPVQVTVVIDTPGSGAPLGFVNLRVRYSGAQGIVQFGVNNFNGQVQYPEDQALDLAQAVAKFHTLSGSPALLVGRIGMDGQCSGVAGDAPDELRATASIFKTWVLGGVARAVAQGLLATDDLVPLVASELAPGGTINAEPLGTPFAVADLATLMMGISDNTATDLLHEEVGRERIGGFIDDSVADPTVLRPLLGISEQFHVFRSFPLDVALAYVDGTEAYQQQFLEEEIEPLGPLVTGPYNHVQLLTQGTWRASPRDVCSAFALMRRLPQGSDALAMANRALGAGVAQPGVRGHWDRAWYKGGSLASGTGLHVLTHAWMLEDRGSDPWVVIAMSNSDGGAIDTFKVQSITSRILQLVAESR